MKKSLITLCVCFSVLSVSAADRLAVVIYEKQGSTAFLLNQRPVASLTATDLKLVCGQDTVLYPLTNYLKMTIEKVGVDTDLDALYEVEAFSVDEQTITASGCQHIWLYSSDGKLVATAEADAAGNVSMNIGQLGKGVYLLRTENNAFKILK